MKPSLQNVKRVKIGEYFYLICELLFTFIKFSGVQSIKIYKWEIKFGYQIQFQIKFTFSHIYKTEIKLYRVKNWSLKHLKLIKWFTITVLVVPIIVLFTIHTSFKVLHVTRSQNQLIKLGYIELDGTSKICSL
jgi:hypothetical protein